jgi:hypothetical protein
LVHTFFTANSVKAKKKNTESTLTFIEMKNYGQKMKYSVEKHINKIAKIHIKSANFSSFF